MAKRATTTTTTRKPRRARTAASAAKPKTDAVIEQSEDSTNPETGFPDIDGPVLPDTPETTDAAEAASDDKTETELKKPELIRRVVAASGMKKKDVKPVVEAMLKELGDALTNGEIMNLQPFGKLQINRQKDKDNGEVIIVKVRRNQQAVDETESLTEKKSDVPLAESAD